MQLQLPHSRGHLQNRQKTGQDRFLSQTKHTYNVCYISIDSTMTRQIKCNIIYISCIIICVALAWLYCHHCRHRCLHCCGAVVASSSLSCGHLHLLLLIIIIGIVSLWHWPCVTHHCHCRDGAVAASSLSSCCGHVNMLSLSCGHHHPIVVIIISSWHWPLACHHCHHLCCDMDMSPSSLSCCGHVIAIIVGVVSPWHWPRMARHCHCHGDGGAVATSSSLTSWCWHCGHIDIVVLAASS